MDGLYLVNYRHTSCQPLMSITALPREEAFAMAARLSAAGTGVAFNRFGKDFSAYYEHRIRTEEWLYEGFVAAGGKPQTRHPLYFVLEGNGYLSEWFGGGEEIRIPVDELEPQLLSFTFGDSMAKLGKPEMRPPFMPDELYGHIERCGGVNELLESIRGQYTYIEAQLWREAGAGV